MDYSQVLQETYDESALADKIVLKNFSRIPCRENKLGLLSALSTTCGIKFCEALPIKKVRMHDLKTGLCTTPGFNLHIIFIFIVNFLKAY